jgi:Crp-like helix-turn-helix domain
MLPDPIPHQNPRQNQLLAALGAADLVRLASGLERVSLRLGDMLYEPGTALQHAYFPDTAIVSLHYVMASGASAEAASVGREGMVGVALFTGADTTPSSAVVQTAGQTWGLMVQMLQTAVCNRHHNVEQQLCRWLLMTVDRIPGHQAHAQGDGQGELTITQELVARMLGVRREGITEAAGKLQHAGLIHSRRGHIAVLDRAGLERYTCECYGVVKKEMARLQPVPLRE